MIPDQVEFTGLTVDPRLINRRWHGPVPSDWTRLEIRNDNFWEDWHVVSWIQANIPGRWALNSTHAGYIILCFEQIEAAVLFKMMDGETAWQERL